MSIEVRLITSHRRYRTTAHAKCRSMETRPRQSFFLACVFRLMLQSPLAYDHFDPMDYATQPIVLSLFMEQTLNFIGYIQPR
jgi:hypothetical protein